MEAKRLTDSELRNALAKNAKIARQGQQNVNIDSEPQGLYAECIDKYSVAYTDMQEWMKNLKQTSEALLTIRDPADASVNEMCATITAYGCTWNEVLPLLIQAAVKDNKYAIDINRINTPNVSETFRKELQINKQGGCFGEHIPIGQIIDGGKAGSIKVKVIRDNWYNKPTDVTIDMTISTLCINSDFVQIPRKWRGAQCHLELNKTEQVLHAKYYMMSSIIQKSACETQQLHERDNLANVYSSSDFAQIRWKWIGLQHNQEHNNTNHAIRTTSCTAQSTTST